MLPVTSLPVVVGAIKGMLPVTILPVVVGGNQRYAPCNKLTCCG